MSSMGSAPSYKQQGGLELSGLQGPPAARRHKKFWAKWSEEHSFPRSPVVLYCTKMHPCVHPSAISPNSSFLQPSTYLEGGVQTQLFCLIVFPVLTQPFAGVTLRNPCRLFFTPGFLIQWGAVRVNVSRVWLRVEWINSSLCGIYCWHNSYMESLLQETRGTAGSVSCCCSDGHKWLLGL